MGMSQVKPVPVVRLRVLLLHLFVPVPPVRFWPRMLPLLRHRMLLVRHLMMWKRGLVFPCPCMLGSAGCRGRGRWSLVGQFVERRSMACQVRAFWRNRGVAHWWRSRHGRNTAYLRRSRHDWHITGRNRPEAPGCQWGNHVRPQRLIFIA